MTMKEWAKTLDGREYREELTKEEAEQAKKDGVVIAFGYSDDIIELYGAIDKEISAFDGGDFGIVKATWCPRNELGEVYTSWLIESSLSHEKFHIYEDGELYCIGLVMRIAASSMDENFYQKLLEEGFFETTDPDSFIPYITNGEKKIKRETVNYLLEDLTEKEVIKILKSLTEG